MRCTPAHVSLSHESVCHRCALAAAKPGRASSTERTKVSAPRNVPLAYDLRAADAIDTNHDVLILLQLLYLNGSVALAIRMNELNNAMTSSMVDDIFYIFQNCSGRAAACGAH